MLLGFSHEFLLTCAFWGCCDRLVLANINIVTLISRYSNFKDCIFNKQLQSSSRRIIFSFLGVISAQSFENHASDNLHLNANFVSHCKLLC